MLCFLRTVPGDGDCQFHACSFHADAWSAGTLRAAAVQYAAEHPQEFADFFPYAAGDTLESWIAHMRRPGHWGDNLSLFCIAHVLRRAVFIYRLGDAPQVLLPSTLEPHAPPLTVWLDESRPGLEHYSPLTRSSTPRKRPAWQKTRSLSTCRAGEEKHATALTTSCSSTEPPLLLSEESASFQVSDDRAEENLERPPEARHVTTLRLRKQGHSLQSIASKLQMSLSSVARDLRLSDYKPTTPAHSPALASKSRDPARQMQCLTLKAQGLGRRQIALQLQLSETTVRRELRRAVPANMQLCALPLHGRPALPRLAKAKRTQVQPPLKVSHLPRKPLNAQAKKQIATGVRLHWSARKIAHKVHCRRALPALKHGQRPVALFRIVTTPDKAELAWLEGDVPSWSHYRSWTFCRTCGLRKPVLAWGCFAPFLLFCKCKNECSSLVQSQSCLYVTPQQDHWPALFWQLSKDVLQSLALCRIQIHYDTLRGGAAPISTRKKKAIVSVVWQDPVQFLEMDSLLAQAVDWLRTNNHIYKHFWDELHAPGVFKPEIGMAKALLGMPGIEVAANLGFILRLIWQTHAQLLLCPLLLCGAISCGKERPVQLVPILWRTLNCSAGFMIALLLNG